MDRLYSGLNTKYRWGISWFLLLLVHFCVDFMTIHPVAIEIFHWKPEMFLEVFRSPQWWWYIYTMNVCRRFFLFLASLPTDVEIPQSKPKCLTHQTNSQRCHLQSHAISTTTKRPKMKGKHWNHIPFANFENMDCICLSLARSFK